MQIATLCYSLTIRKSNFVYQFQFPYEFHGKTFMEKSKICNERELQNYDADWYKNQYNAALICETSIKGCGCYNKKMATDTAELLKSAKRLNFSEGQVGCNNRIQIIQ